MFKKILITNRGEIACRVIKTARKMGIATVAIYSEADRYALHVDQADEAIFIGPSPVEKSYLNMGAILDAIRDTGADAVHPGYGFLSENAKFAEALQKAGIAFIGPGPKAITVMGDKITSKKLAEKAGVNTVPGHAEAVADAKEAVKVAKDIGYPVMLKASAGGGGKGMRIAHDDEKIIEGFGPACNEARSSFGDDTMFVEKFIEEPRHIEIQLIADTHGNTLYLGERECSIQRRYQKVVEEAPSPFIDAKTRRRMGEQAVALARAVDYASAGTIEFLVDSARNFYFLEMNTRLQVEHPVTECVTGLDLVELMIRVAAGEKLSITQKDVKLDGWAIEARVYAEDPFRNFLPSVGRLVRYRAPTESEHVRVDTGVCEGSEISIYYDPLIAKLITYGKSREQAIAAMKKALNTYFIRGIKHNIAFLAALMALPRFVAGELSTNLIAEEYPDGLHNADIVPENAMLLVAVAASAHRAYQQRAALISGQVPNHQHKVADNWVVVLGGVNHAVRVVPIDGGYELTLDESECHIETEWKLGDPLFKGRLDGVDFCVQFERAAVNYRVGHGGAWIDVLVMSQRAAELSKVMLINEPPDTSKFLLSPMPGLLVSVAVEIGEKIKIGDELVVVEAMKMENILRAERDAIVAAIRAEEGASLTVDQVILEFV